MPDIAWTVISWAIALLGVLFAALALGLFRRGRGRGPLCPRCRYDLSGAALSLPIRCPECGTEIRQLREMFRRQRRWKLAAFVLAVSVPGAWVVGQVPVIRRDGWFAPLSTDVLLWMARVTGWDLSGPDYSQLGQRRSGLPEEMMHRVMAGQLGEGQLDRFRSIVVPQLLFTRPQWPVGSEVAVFFKNYGSILFEPGNSGRVLAGPAGAAHDQCNGPYYFGLRTVSLGNFWRDWGSAGVGVCVAETRSVPVALVLRYENRTGLQTMWEGTTHIQTAVNGTIDDILPTAAPETLASVEAALKKLDIGWRRSQFESNGQGTVWIDFNIPQTLGASPRMGLGLQLQVMCNDRVVGQRRVYRAAIEGDYFAQLDRPVPVDFRGAGIDARDFDSANLSLRITSDDDMSLRDFSAKVRWVGSVTIPLTSANTNLGR